MGSLKRVAVLCGFTLLFAATAQAEDWQVAKDEDGIKVSLSEIAGSKYKAYRGVTVIKAPLAKVQALQEVKRQQELLPSPARAQETKELGWDDVTPVDMVGLEVGYRLIPLVDRNQGGQLLARIKGVRKKLSQ